MAETFTLENTNRWWSTVGHALLAAMTNHVKAIGQEHRIREVFDVGDHKAGLNVVFTINGVEVSFRSVMEAWEAERDSWIQEAAKQMMFEKLNKFSVLFSNVQRSLEDAMQATFPDIDLDLRD